MTNDDAVKRALERLDAREDPPPPPELPPEPPEVAKVVQDLRLVVTSHVRGNTTRFSWAVSDGHGREVAARAGLVDLFVSTARLVSMTDSWPRPLWQAARNVMRAMEELQRTAPPPETRQ